MRQRWGGREELADWRDRDALGAKRSGIGHVARRLAVTVSFPEHHIHEIHEEMHGEIPL